MERMRPYIQRLAHELVSGWIHGQRVDVVADFAVRLPVTVICEMLGVPEADGGLVRGWSNDLFLTGQHERIDAASHTRLKQPRETNHSTSPAWANTPPVTPCHGSANCCSHPSLPRVDSIGPATSKSDLACCQRSRRG